MENITNREIEVVAACVIAMSTFMHQDVKTVDDLRNGAGLSGFSEQEIARAEELMESMDEDDFAELLAKAELGYKTAQS